MPRTTVAVSCRGTGRAKRKRILFCSSTHYHLDTSPRVAVLPRPRQGGHLRQLLVPGSLGGRTGPSRLNLGTARLHTSCTSLAPYPSLGLRSWGSRLGKLPACPHGGRGWQSWARPAQIMCAFSGQLARRARRRAVCER